MEQYPENYSRQLKRLLHITVDGERNYKEASEHAHSDYLRELFLRHAKEREQIAEELNEQMGSLGEKPHKKEGTDTYGIIHRTIMAIKSIFTKSEKKDRVLLESCRDGDLAALETYDEILQGSVLEKTGLKAFLIKQRLKISESLNEIDQLYFARFKTNPEV